MTPTTSTSTKALNDLKKLLKEHKGSSPRDGLKSMIVVYEDALRRGMDVGVVRKGSISDDLGDGWHVRFSVDLGDKPKVWGVTMYGMYLSVRCDVYYYVFRPIVSLCQNPGTSIPHPHLSVMKGTICVGVSLNHLLLYQPKTVIPYALQAASTVSGGYMTTMAKQMSSRGMEIPQYAKDRVEVYYRKGYEDKVPW